MNQSAIPYHFGGKEGVYAAVLEQTAQDIAARLDLPDAPPATAREAATQLEALMRGFATALLDSEASAARSLLLAREQLQPTPKFEAIHAGLFMPLHEAVTERVAAIRREAPDSRDSILRAHAILGQAMSSPSRARAACAWAPAPDARHGRRDRRHGRQALAAARD